MHVYLRALMAILALTAGLHASAIELAGVQIPTQVDVAGTPLQLNGAGVRYKAVFKVYTAALYTTRKVSTLDELSKVTGPRRVSITMLRDIDATELGKLFTRGMEDNMDRATFTKLIPGILRMGQVFADHKKLVAGDNFTVDWLPGRGMLLAVKGKSEGEPFKEVEFFNALMAIWMGPNPADWQLKNALLDVKN
jgi:hypothetical protein